MKNKIGTKTLNKKYLISTSNINYIFELQFEFYKEYVSVFELGFGTLLANLYLLNRENTRFVSLLTICCLQTKRDNQRHLKHITQC